MKGGITTSEMAAACGVQPRPLLRILRALASFDIDPALIIVNHAAYRMDFWRKKLRTRAGDFDSRCM
jgi:hypothetical protein